MIGLIYKDIVIVRRQLAYYLLFIAIYVALVVAKMFDPTILSGFIVIFAMLLPMSSIAYDDQARWASFAVATPAGRGGVVSAKYLFTLLCIFGGAVFTGAVMAILQILGLPSLPLGEVTGTILGSMGVSLAMNAVILPLLLKFGSEKSRIISLLIFVALFGGVFFVMNAAEDFTVPPWLPAALPVMLGILAVGGFFLSYCIARGIYHKKEL